MKKLSVIGAIVSVVVSRDAMGCDGAGGKVTALGDLSYTAAVEPPEPFP